METKMIKSVGILIYKDDKVLLVKHGASAKHKTGVYGLPAGKVKENETDADAAVRELEEETGLQAEKDDMIQLPKIYSASIEMKDGIKTFSFNVFHCRVYHGKLRATSETEPLWMAVEDAERLELLPNVKDIIEEYAK